MQNANLRELHAAARFVVVAHPIRLHFIPNERRGASHKTVVPQRRQATIRVSSRAAGCDRRRGGQAKQKGLSFRQLMLACRKLLGVGLSGIDDGGSSRPSEAAANQLAYRSMNSSSWPTSSGVSGQASCNPASPFKSALAAFGPGSSIKGLILLLPPSNGEDIKAISHH